MIDSEASPSSPTTQNPASCNRSIDRAMLATRACGRCNSAPADARTAAGVTSAARLVLVTSTAAPAASADRAAAPRFCGSLMPSSTTAMASGRYSRSARPRSVSECAGSTGPSLPSDGPPAPLGAREPRHHPLMIRGQRVESRSRLDTDGHTARLCSVEQAPASPGSPSATTRPTPRSPARADRFGDRTPATDDASIGDGRRPAALATIALAAHVEMRPSAIGTSFGTTTATAMQPIPSPCRPSPSGRVAFTDTGIGSQAHRGREGAGDLVATRGDRGLEADHGQIAGGGREPSRVHDAEGPAEQLEPPIPAIEGSDSGKC